MRVYWSFFVNLFKMFTFHYFTIDGTHMYIYHFKVTSRMGTTPATLHGLPPLSYMKDICTLKNKICTRKTQSITRLCSSRWHLSKMPLFIAHHFVSTFTSRTMNRHIVVVEPTFPVLLPDKRDVHARKVCNRTNLEEFKYQTLYTDFCTSS